MKTPDGTVAHPASVINSPLLQKRWLWPPVSGLIASETHLSLCEI